MQTLGIMRESGHEHFNGSLVIPIFDLDGQRGRQMYGRKITRRTCGRDTPLHLYLPGAASRRVERSRRLEASKEIILCEALIDALTFWCAGYRNVTASYGVNGFTDEHRGVSEARHEENLHRLRPRRSRREGGGRAMREELMEMGIECFRVLFPKGMDANEYALKVQPAAKSLG